MKNLLVSFLLSSLRVLAIAQQCNCPNERFVTGLRPAKIFTFSNHKKIGLCGLINDSTIKDSYEEFAIFECGETKPIQKWGALSPCKVTKNQDTLTIAEFDWLYIGTKFNAIKVPFFINKFYYVGLELKHWSYYRTDLKKYSHKQITEVINKYRHLKKGNEEHTINVANMLFWAYVSGNNDAELYLKTIKDKFGPFDGAVAEEWDMLCATYERWKKENTFR